MLFRSAWRGQSCKRAQVSARTTKRRGGKDALVLGNLDLLLLSLPALERAEVSAALQTLGSHKALDLGTAGEDESQPQVERWERNVNARLGVGLGSLGLGDDLATDNELPDVVGLGEVKEATDLGSTL